MNLENIKRDDWLLAGLALLAALTALFIVLKFLFQIHFSLFGFGFWAAVVPTAGLVAVAMRAHQGKAVFGSQPAGPTAATS